MAAAGSRASSSSTRWPSASSRPGRSSVRATFVGYLVDGVPGALASTAGIFLPSFLFVAITHPFLPRLRSWRWTSAFLDGVNAAAIALMGRVTVQLGQDVRDNWWQAALFVLGGIVLVKLNPNSAWLVLAGAVAGLLQEALT